MIKPKRSAEQQVADELDRRTLHPLSSRQTISDSQAEPEFHANHKRLRAERLAREAVEIGLKRRGNSERAKADRRDTFWFVAAPSAMSIITAMTLIGFPI